jgi:dTDP-4-dehydrorhamnose 3,5-epimerase
MDNQNEGPIINTTIEGVYKVMRPTHADERGFFHEIFRKKELEEVIGHEFNIVQANHSRSTRGVLRGIHRATWNKLVTAISGKVQQVVVDLREGSPTFGKYESFVLGEEGPQYSVFVPAGCGNAFLTLSEESNYAYLVDDYWAEGKEIGILATDPELKIEWFFDKLNLSDKDQKARTVRELFPAQFIA